MTKNPSDDLVHMLREHGAEYDHYLDLLEDEADSQDVELAMRLERASAHPTGGERQAFRDYLRQREASQPSPDDANEVSERHKLR